MPHSVATSEAPTREQIERLQVEVAKFPQIEVATEHYFSDGMYCRKMTLPKDALIVGKMHKRDHFFLIASGEMIAWTEAGMRRLIAGDVIESKAGTKRTLLCITDSVGINVHRTDKTDLDEIEADLLEPDDTALFDSGNALRFDAAKFRELTARVIAAEKPGVWHDWTDMERALYESGDWRAFSIARGYTDAEIADYSQWIDMAEEGKKAGVNPFAFIADLAANAADRTILQYREPSSCAG